MRLSTILSLLLLFCIACNYSNEKKAKKKDVNEIESTQKIYKENINPSVILKLPIQKALDKFKSPIRKISFDMRDGLPESRVGLYNIIPPKDYELHPLIIQEIVWRLDSSKNITIWYKKINSNWLPIHHTIWDKGDVF